MDADTTALGLLASKYKYRAASVNAKHGQYFEAKVGTEAWFDAVPRANRGQVLAQAAVLDADYVLFTESVGGRRLYSVLVHVTQEQRKIFADSIDKWCIPHFRPGRRRCGVRS